MILYHVRVHSNICTYIYIYTYINISHKIKSTTVDRNEIISYEITFNYISQLDWTMVPYITLYVKFAVTLYHILLYHLQPSYSILNDVKSNS